MSPGPDPIAVLGERHPVLRPSRFWEDFNRKNRDQLSRFGVGNVKRHQALNYFTWAFGVEDQLSFLRRNLDSGEVLRALLGGTGWVSPWRQVNWGPRARWRYCVFVRMLWEYARSRDRWGILDLEEPTFGNPLPVVSGGRLISQDLANSALEISCMLEAFEQQGVHGRAPSRVIELGAGYGRTAWAWLRRFPGVRYVIVDVPPALLISQEYLSSVLPDRKIFPAQPWETYDAVKGDLESADISFLLPSQALLLPDDFAELFFTISTLGEMTMDQIRLYFDLIDRVTRGIFYNKQWKVSENTFDELVVREEDYPTPAHWESVYRRTAPVQTRFFESAFWIE